MKLLLEEGPISATDVGERLGLTPAGVRRHLDALLESGQAQVVTTAWLHRGRGRPPKRYQLTSAGRGRLGHAYDDLAASAMRQLRAIGGDAAITEFARTRVDSIVGTIAPAADATPQALTDKANEIAEAFTSAGFAASTRDVGRTGRGPGTGALGVQVCQHHCPVSHVAEEFPELCAAELDAFRNLLGTHVQRLATIANGDCACTTHIPLAATSPAAKQTPEGVR